MANSLRTLEMALPLGSIETYVQRVQGFPVLTLEEEQALTRRFYEEGDIEAARELIMAHLRFVVRVANGYMGYGLPLADLIQEGNIGLMKAVKRFNPNMGVRLVSFAVHWIKAEIHEFIIRNWRIVKVATTKAQRKLFFNLRNAKKRLGWFTKEEVAAVAKDLNVAPKDVLEMESRLNAQDAAFDPYESDDEDIIQAPAHYLEDKSQLLEQSFAANDNDTYEKNSLYEALDQLDERSREILSARWLVDKKATLQDLAERYQISAERVRQIEKMAIDKLKQVVLYEEA